jgi:polyhydroxyalkanoate synthesis regulator phasin
MNRSSGICLLLGATVGVAGTYFALQNKDRIIKKFEELEDKVEARLEKTGITTDKAKEFLEKANKTAHLVISKIQDMVRGKNFNDAEKEQLLAEITALKEKISQLETN